MPVSVYALRYVVLQTHWSHARAPDKSNISITIFLWVFVVEPNKIIGYYYEHKDVLCQLSFNLWFCARVLMICIYIHYALYYVWLRHSIEIPGQSRF